MKSLSTIRPFVVSTEAEMGYGEDSYTVGNLDEFCYIAAFDGCGGSGARKYPLLNNRTGAWLASRACSDSLERFIADGKFNFSSESTDALEKYIFSQLNYLKTQCSQEGGLRIGGSMIRSMPSTISIVSAKEENDQLLCNFLWAGDSRGYILDSNGLSQITIDDIDSNADDAFLNIREDGILTNVANGDIPFELHQKMVYVNSPVLLISATDGGFAYLHTPMDFEYVILNTLVYAETPEQWIGNLTQQLYSVAGDDVTVLIAPIGYGDFINLKEMFYQRHKELYENYIVREQDASDEQLKGLWEIYKSDYYRWN